MAHHRYQTEGIIFGSYPRGESNKAYAIFSRDFGMIYAAAQGVRNSASKLRSNVSNFNHARLDLIRGKDMWRLVDADSISGARALPLPAERACARAARIIRRLMRGERQEPRLFADIILFIEFIRVHETRQSLTRAAEIAIAMRTLAELGYGGEGEIWRTFGENSFSEFLVGEAAERKSDCVRLINARLAETHL